MPQQQNGFADHGDRPVSLNVLRRLAEVAPGNPDADLAAFAQFRKRAEGVGDVQGIMEIRHHDRGAKANLSVPVRRSRSAPPSGCGSEFVVDPDLLEAAIRAEDEPAARDRAPCSDWPNGDKLQAEPLR